VRVPLDRLRAGTDVNGIRATADRIVRGFRRWRDGRGPEHGPNARLRVGLVVDRSFHRQNRWVVAVTPYLIDAMRRRWHCSVISNQAEYDRIKDRLDVLIQTPPGWSSPYLTYTPDKPRLKYLLMSDPHRFVREREAYFLASGFSYALAYYYHPTLRHFRAIPPERIVHFPWAIPEAAINAAAPTVRDRSALPVFGALNGPIYTDRRWCMEFDFVRHIHYSGVENRVFEGQRYFCWLRELDAAIAATSFSPDIRLTVAKYFEIAAAGALLFAMETDDLERLGFRDGENCVVFNRESFEEKARRYLASPEAYLAIRTAGRDLIRTRHTIGCRLASLDRHVAACVANPEAVVPYAG
jgi:hypothetical protein